MDYNQHMPGRSNYDPSRAYRDSRSGGGGGVFLVVAIMLSALLVVIWLAGTDADQTVVQPDPAALDQTAPAVGSAADGQ